MVGLPIFGFVGMHLSTYLGNTFVFSHNDKGGEGDNSEGPPAKKWYQISKVQGTEGTYNLLGLEFQSPRMFMLTKVRNYMGGVIKEVLADDALWMAT